METFWDILDILNAGGDIALDKYKKAKEIEQSNKLSDVLIYDTSLPQNIAGQTINYNIIILFIIILAGIFFIFSTK